MKILALKKETKQAHFYAYGQIGEQDPLFKLFTGEDDPIVSPDRVLDFINENQDAEELVIHINSRGGSVDAGFAIHDLLANSGKSITTIAEGLVASIATVVMLAGKKRKFMENAQGMIHNPWVDLSFSGGMDAEALQTLAEDVQREEDRIVDFYAKETNSKREDLITMMKEETYFDAAKAKELGFATEVLKPVKAFAYIHNNNTNLKTTTMAKIQTGGKKKLTLMEKIDRIFNQTVKAEDAQSLDATTEDGVTLTIDDPDGDGVPMVDDTVTSAKDADGKDVATASTTFKLADGSSITTDENSVITDVTPAPAANAAAPVVAPVVAPAAAPVVAAAPAAAAPSADVLALTKQITDLTTERDALKLKVDGFAELETKMETKLNKILASIGSNGDPVTSSTTQFRGNKNGGKKLTAEDYKAGINKIKNKGKAPEAQGAKK